MIFYYMSNANSLSLLVICWSRVILYVLILRWVPWNHYIDVQYNDSKAMGRPTPYVELYQSSSETYIYYTLVI